MSLFKKFGNKQDTPPPGSSKNGEQTASHGRPRSGTDPQARFEVFRSHWQQVFAIIDKSNSNASPNGKKQSLVEDVESVIHYVDQMGLCLAEEESEGLSQGPILEYLLNEDILEKILMWIGQCGQFKDKMRIHHLKFYLFLSTDSKQQILLHKPVLRPLLKLLCSCVDHKEMEKHVVSLLHQLCIRLSANTQLLELFFDASSDENPAKFMLFSLLIPYVHRQGRVGEQARDALLLIMSLSAKNEEVGKYIADNSDFCPVLATGLSGLYSSLPQKIDIPSDDWYHLTQDDIDLIPDLVSFLNSLEFCDAVAQVAHPMVRDQLLNFIYNGFLEPVVGPALHQSCAQACPDLESSVEEVLAATAYLELFLRKIQEPTLMKTFLKFILIAKYDDVNIIESLIGRINSGFRLCMVSLALFKTLVDLNSEEVMFQLVFKYLIPCNHVMVSQRRAVRDLDIYGKTAEKFLSLKPSCCNNEDSDTSSVEEGSTGSRSSSPETSSPVKSPASLKKDNLELSYIQYLHNAKASIQACMDACQCWTLPYDGENPPPDVLDADSAEDSAYGETEAGDKEPEASSSRDRSKSESSKADETTENNTETAKDEKNSLMMKGGQYEVEKEDKLGDNVKLSPRTSCVDSALSDTDSAISLNSSQTYTPPLRMDGDKAQEVDVTKRSSSGELNAFIASLKQVEEPEDICDNINDSMHELDEVIDMVTSFSSSPNQSKIFDVNSQEGAETDQIEMEAADVDKDKAAVGVEVMLNGDVGELPEVKPRSESQPELLRKDSTLSAKYKIGKPDIGPFLSALLIRLDNMVQNSLYVNLLLSGIIARLACFPQPLIRSFLLNQALVFQPTVKSLSQVLTSVKHKIDRFSYTIKDFDPLMHKARQFLAWREENSGIDGKIKSESSLSPVTPRNRSLSAIYEAAKSKKRGSISDLFGFRRNPSPQQAKGRGQQLKKNDKGYQFLNRRLSNDSVGSTDANEIIKIKNAIYCALIMEEFVKELAALSQEHSVFMADDYGGLFSKS